MPLISSAPSVRNAQPPGATITIPKGDTPPWYETRTYVLKVDTSRRHLNFSYIDPPSVPAGSKDKALDMRVRDAANKIELVLDDTLIDWYFPSEDDTISIVGWDLPDPDKRYVNLEFESPGRCRKLWFYALLLNVPDGNGGKKPNTDQINIRVVLDQDVGGKAVEPLYLYIDPGIKNPGDDLR